MSSDDESEHNHKLQLYSTFATPMKYSIGAPDVWGEIGERTWEDLLVSQQPMPGDGQGDFRPVRYTFCTCIGLYAGDMLTYGTLNFFFGPGVGSTLTHESGKLIIVLPEGRLLVADLRNETAEYLNYSDEAACVSPKVRQLLNERKGIT